MKQFFVEYGNEYFDEFSVPAKDEAEAEVIKTEKANKYKFADIVIFEY